MYVSNRQEKDPMQTPSSPDDALDPVDPFNPEPPTHHTIAALPPDVFAVLGKAANAIRQLSMEAVQKANSGHPGLPMGCAELGAYLYGMVLRHNPKNPYWLNRDRMILSAGHGSMWLYSCLNLAGFPMEIEDIENFRQLHSKTPGHPEKHESEGVEVTTGPLGQGVGNAVGLALGLKILATKFNRPNYPLFDCKVYCLAGDGCIMEGVSSEASSLAGHLQLDNLILFYDANQVTLDGPLGQSGSEDTIARYRAYGWDTYEVDGADLQALHQVISTARATQTRPILIMVHTIIGKGSPNKAGTYKVHGSPLGEEEVKATKAALGLPDEPFFVPQAVRHFFEKKLQQDIAREERWENLLTGWRRHYPDLSPIFDACHLDLIPTTLEEDLRNLPIPPSLASRSSSQHVLNFLSHHLPQLIGGSADLSGSDMTMMKEYPLITRNDFSGRNIKYGIREFGMATMATGMSTTDMLRPFIGTFLTFSDYMRNAIRLAALSRSKVIYQFTHDSIFLGEDGPTHQPIEHLASLRAIPHLYVIRPACSYEVKMAWLAALHYAGPVALVLSRQGLPDLPSTEVPYAEGMAKGAYIVKRETRSPDYTLIATGSELSLALDVATELEKHGKAVRVISMPCTELFDQQGPDYKRALLGGNIGTRVSIEAGVEMGWHRYIGMDGIAIAMEDFGASAPASALAKEFGFTVDAILERLL